VGGCELDSHGSDSTVAGSCERGNEPPRSVKNGNFCTKFGTKLLKNSACGISFNHTVGTLVLNINLCDTTFRRFDSLTFQVVTISR
jgi:hypothetical protein